MKKPSVKISSWLPLAILFLVLGVQLATGVAAYLALSVELGEEAAVAVRSAFASQGLALLGATAGIALLLALVMTRRIEARQAEAEERALRDKHETMRRMADDLKGTVGGVVEAVSAAATELQASAEAMAGTADQTNVQMAAVAAAAEQASINVQTVAAAAEELSSSIAEIARQVAQSSSVASGAVREAEHTRDTVRSLVGAAKRIGIVVDLITDIAERTNLLALNATIEAARAGEAGRGFAVVAAEVKSLANQTAKATDQIGGQIAALQEATENAAAAIDGIGKTVGRIDEIAAAIAGAIEEQGAATREIARNVEEAATGTREVSANVGGVTMAAAETGHAAGQTHAASSELAEQSERLRAEVDRFLAHIRSG